MQFFFDITALLVALSILYASWMWYAVWRYRFPIPVWDVARIFAVAFSVQLVIYTFFSFFLIDIQLRAYMVRTSIIVICLSQAIPLTLAYRARENEQRIR